MATVLNSGKQTPLNFTPGTILILKPTVTPPTNVYVLPPICVDLTLFNKNGDILLNISSSYTKNITCKDRARRSLGSGWGNEQTVNMKGRWVDGVTISVHHYLTDSEFGRYQNLFNGKTICHFDKRFPGPATQISSGGNEWASSWDVVVCKIDDLFPEERRALVAGR